MTKENKYGWKEYQPNRILHERASRFWQKKIKCVYINVVEYPPFLPREELTKYEVEFQIPEELSPIKRTMNINLFTYAKKDFLLFEKDAKKIIELLNLCKKTN